MSLQKRLERIKRSFEEEAPDEVLEVMRRATRELEDSDILAGVVSEGEEAPGFALEDTEGRTVRLEELRADGPVILAFYRGRW